VQANRRVRGPDPSAIGPATVTAVILIHLENLRVTNCRDHPAPLTATKQYSIH